MVQPRRPQVTRGLPMQQRPSAMMQAPAQPAVPARMAAFSQRSVAPSQPMVQQAAPSRMSFGAPRVAQPQAMAAVPSQVRQAAQAPQISSYVQQQAQPRQQMQRIQQNQMSAYGQPQPTPPRTGGVTPMPQQAQNGNLGMPGSSEYSVAPEYRAEYRRLYGGGGDGAGGRFNEPPRTDLRPSTNPDGSPIGTGNGMPGRGRDRSPPGGYVIPPDRYYTQEMPQQPGGGLNQTAVMPNQYVPPASGPKGIAYVPEEVPDRIHLEPEQYVPPATAAPASPVGLGATDMEAYIQNQMAEARNSAAARSGQLLASQPAPTRQNADGSFMGPIGGASFTTKTGFNPENKVAGVATPAFYKQGGKIAPKAKAMAKPASRASAKPAVKGYAKGGTVMASSRGDGIAQRGKTKGRIR